MLASEALLEVQVTPPLATFLKAVRVVEALVDVPTASKETLVVADVVVAKFVVPVAVKFPTAIFDEVELVIVALVAEKFSTDKIFAHKVARTFKLEIEEVEIVVVPRVVVPATRVPALVLSDVRLEV